MAIYSTSIVQICVCCFQIQNLIHLLWVLKLKGMGISCFGVNTLLVVFAGSLSSHAERPRLFLSANCRSFSSLLLEEKKKSGTGGDNPLIRIRRSSQRAPCCYCKAHTYTPMVQKKKKANQLALIYWLVPFSGFPRAIIWNWINSKAWNEKDVSVTWRLSVWNIKANYILWVM